MKSKIEFWKISATGNDFIVIDNRDGLLNAETDKNFIRTICERRTSVGADGVILLENSEQADYKYVHINADGSIAEMCGNGSRAIAYFAVENKISGNTADFEINNKMYKVNVREKFVQTDFFPPDSPQFNLNIVEDSELEEGGFIDTGVPHFVLFVKDVSTVNVAELGKKYRHHSFFEKGSNVNFVEIVDQDTIKMRTFERGVEGETLACGTGAVASAIISHLKKATNSPTKVHFPGGELFIRFDEGLKNVSLAGPVSPIYKGILL